MVQQRASLPHVLVGLEIQCKPKEENGRLKKMKVIQSFWSKPLFKANEDIKGNRYHGGWINFRYCLMSMAYSCLTISRFYPHLELYTDSFGVKLFKDILKLPYQKFHTLLDDMINIDEALWAYGKIMTYSAQKEPFLHIDNDVFIWQEFPNIIEHAGLVCQSLEMIEDYSLTDYKIALDYIRCNYGMMPKILENSKCKSAANMGLFGGNNLDFIMHYCKEAKSAFNDMYDGIIQSGCKKGIFNIIYEQLLLTELANKHNQQITYLIPYNDLDEIVKYSTIETAPYESKYMHCLGGLKTYNYICEQIEYRLKYEYPVYYNRILSYLNKEQVEYLENDMSMKNYDSFHSIYSQMYKAKTISEVMTDFEFRLKTNCNIEENGEDYYINSPQGKFRLKGWNIFITLFSEANTGMAVSQEIYREGYLPDLTYDQIFTKVFYLIMESLYITKFLTVA